MSTIFYVLLSLVTLQAVAGFPPTTSKVSGDSTDITTFKYQFPNFTGTHTGTMLSLGVNSVAGGGTGQSSYTDGQLLIGNSTGNTLTKTSLTAGSGITITPGSGSITIAASGGGSGGTLVGTANWASTAGCTWSVTPAGAFTGFAADTDCPTPTLTGDFTATGTKIPGVVVGTGSVNTTSTYVLMAQGLFFHPTATRYQCAWRISEGTNAGTITTSMLNASLGGIGMGTVVSVFKFNTTGARTVQLQVANDDNSSTCNIVNNAYTNELSMQLYKF